MKRTNLPRRGTTREVGGMISARRRKNTVNESRIEMDRDTWMKRKSFKRCFAKKLKIPFHRYLRGDRRQGR